MKEIYKLTLLKESFRFRKPISKLKDKIELESDRSFYFDWTSENEFKFGLFNKDFAKWFHEELMNDFGKYEVEEIIKNAPKELQTKEFRDKLYNEL